MSARSARGEFQRIIRIGQLLPQLGRLLGRGEFRFQFEQVPYTATRLSWKKRINFFIAGLNQFIRLPRPLGRPVMAQLEPANVCNLRCPLCFTTSMNSSRPPTLMSLDTFRRFIDDLGDTLLLIVLWNWGEPFLNPELTAMIEYAAARGILVHSSTNGNLSFDDGLAERIVRSGLTSLVFAVDGATPETYRTYRVGGDLERVKQNLGRLVAAKRRLGSATPKLIVRFVAMRHNESELPAVERLASEMGADYFSIKSVDMPPALGPDLDQSFAPAEDRFRRYEYETGGSFRRKQRSFVCVRPWKRITVDAGGEVISCEYDYRNQYGFGRIGAEASALSVWKSRRGRWFRSRFRKGHNDDFYHCRACTYKDMRSEECILEVRDLSRSRATPEPCGPA